MNIFKKITLLANDPETFFNKVKSLKFKQMLKNTIPLIGVLFVISFLLSMFSFFEQIKGVTFIALIGGVSLLLLVLYYLILPWSFNFVLRLFKKKPSYKQTLNVFLHLAYFLIIPTVASVMRLILLRIFSYSVIAVSTISYLFYAINMLLFLWLFFIFVTGVSTLQKVKPGRVILTFLMTVFGLWLVITSLGVGLQLLIMQI